MAPEFRDPKTMARSLRVELQSRFDLVVGHSQCLEIVARLHGADSWNVLAARQSGAQDGATAEAVPWGAADATIPVLQIFSVSAAQQFYVDFLGFRLDFGGPAGGEGTLYYGQVSRATTTLHLCEVAYEPGPGSTVFVWINGIEDLREELNARREKVRVWGPAVWAPELEDAPWGARVFTVADPFGNHLRFNEPHDHALRERLPRWAGPGGAGAPGDGGKER